mmetsp:Transcript_103248/g.194292  ORF Transcript_103248/g.194292 Transcript_103248/m.194292 type:complete len:200 (-) Transcript_103248:50-649(-)
MLWSLSLASLTWERVPPQVTTQAAPSFFIKTVAPVSALTALMFFPPGPMIVSMDLTVNFSTSVTLPSSATPSVSSIMSLPACCPLPFGKPLGLTSCGAPWSLPLPGTTLGTTTLPFPLGACGCSQPSSMPSMPSMPSKPSMPSMPSTPSIPSMPSMPSQLSSMPQFIILCIICIICCAGCICMPFPFPHIFTDHQQGRQ